jgi:hypothetical protein
MIDLMSYEFRGLFVNGGCKGSLSHGKLPVMFSFLISASYQISNPFPLYWSKCSQLEHLFS